MKRPRRIRFIRHGQSEFNAAFELIRPKDPMIFDARLTEKGAAKRVPSPAKACGTTCSSSSPRR